jgi:hypothetical protein
MYDLQKIKDEAFADELHKIASKDSRLAKARKDNPFAYKTLAREHITSPIAGATQGAAVGAALTQAKKLEGSKYMKKIPGIKRTAKFLSKAPKTTVGVATALGAGLGSAFAEGAQRALGNPYLKARDKINKGK